MKGQHKTRDIESPLVEIRVVDERVRAWGSLRFHSAMAAAVDLFACIDAPLALAAQAPATLVSSGVAIHIADPHIAAIVVPRSGLGHKGLVLGNLVGVIDADYMGPVLISAWNRRAAGGEAIVIEPGDRIAQMLFVPILRPRFAVVETFSSASERGPAGFGSTGGAAG